MFRLTLYRQTDDNIGKLLTTAAALGFEYKVETVPSNSPSSIPPPLPPQADFKERRDRLLSQPGEHRQVTELLEMHLTGDTVTIACADATSYETGKGEFALIELSREDAHKFVAHLQAMLREQHT